MIVCMCVSEQALVFVGAIPSLISTLLSGGGGGVFTRFYLREVILRMRLGTSLPWFGFDGKELHMCIYCKHVHGSLAAIYLTPLKW